MPIEVMNDGFQRGFTLVELIIAMAVFSFMLLIILSGFTNVVAVHNSAVASNVAQDNARAAMDTLVEAIRSSNGTIVVTPVTSTLDTLCVGATSGPDTEYYVSPGAFLGTAGVMYKMATSSCNGGSLSGVYSAITNPYVTVKNFSVVQAAGPSSTHPDEQITLTVASNNSTTKTTGGVTTCNLALKNAAQYCSVITLTSGASPR